MDKKEALLPDWTAKLLQTTEISYYFFVTKVRLDRVSSVMKRLSSSVS